MHLIPLRVPAYPRLPSRLSGVCWSAEQELTPQARFEVLNNISLEHVAPPYLDCCCGKVNLVPSLIKYNICTGFWIALAIASLP
jgi:hypothetical protein